MPHLPGLDGLRGLAVIGVLLFHGGFAWAEGGFLGVSTFFTLSGFLITNLLVREHDRTHTIALGKFWVRRFRRLLPAALVTIGLVGLVWWRIGSPEQLDGLRADMLGALAYAANWRFLFAGTSYADLFSAPSPLQHFWSLAIEEQFYLLFPPLVWGLMHVGGRRLLTGVLVAATTVSVALQLALGDDIDRVYYGTGTRASELLVGAILAVWWSGRTAPARRVHAASDGGRVLTRVADVVGGLGLVAMVVAWGSVGQTSTRLTHGGFFLYALGTVAIIWGATRPGVVARLLAVPALRWAGLISYGLYLYHWPIFLWLDEDRTGLATGPLFVVRMVVTIAIALVSYFLLEQPIRRGARIRTGRSLLSAGLAGATVVAATAFVVTLDPPQSQIPYADVGLGDFGTRVLTPADDPAAVQLATPARTVMIVGDSGTVDATPALTAAFSAAGATKVVEAASPGFGLTNNDAWREDWPALIAEHDPDLVLVMLGGWDISEDGEIDEDSYAAVVDDAAGLLSAGGADVLWLSMLPGGTTPDRPPDAVFEQLPGRFPGVVEYHDVQRALRVPDDAREVLEFEDGAEEWPRSYVAADGSVVLLRKPDNWHLCPTGAERLALDVNAAAAELGWAVVAPPDWIGGAWRDDPRYDDPSGGCVVD
jgi:peptidoglycan/LPS O-acetylase OafA/YrhL